MGLANTIRAVLRLTLAAVREWPSRAVDSTVTVLGFATVAGILAAVLALAAGYRHIFDAAAQDSTAIVVSQGSESEGASNVPTVAVGDVMQAPGVAQSRGEPLIAENMLGSMPVRYRQRNLAAAITLRGVSPAMFTIDKELRIVRGRWFRPGLKEVVIGEGAVGHFRGLAVGDRVVAEGTIWTVVGVFSAGPQFFSSEAWTSLGSLQEAERHRDTYSSLYVQLTSPGALKGLARALDRDPQTDLRVVGESAYFAHQSSLMSKLIIRVGGFFTTMMAAAAVFGAMSTLLLMVEARRFEWAVLRAMGYPNGVVFAATFLEGILLGLVGGILGTAMVYVSLNGYAASTLGVGAEMAVSTATPQVFFHFLVSGSTVFQAILCSIAMGLAGGLYPSIRAARMPVVAALKDF